VAGGFRVCTFTLPEATDCGSTPDDDECCSSAECSAGKCYNFAELPHCGGAQPADMNICIGDQCADHADCPQPGTPNASSYCAPAGTFGAPFASCVLGFCATDADCTAAPGGVCAPIDNPCCATPSALACVYEGGCRTSADCDVGYCDVDFDTGTGTCRDDGGPYCPA
jgi:hypothetical protein